MDGCLQNIIETTGLSRCFGEKRVLDDINLTVVEGEFVSVIGKSGAGKSTLINILGLLDPEYEGEYKFCGNDMRNNSDARRTKLRSTDIGYVFQAYHLIPSCTVEENILLPASYSKHRVSKEEIDSLVERLDLGEILKQKAALLSGGEKQRVSIARALINNPRLVIADEPTGNLDEENTERVYGILNALHKAGTTILMVTHNRELASRTGRCLSLRDGKMVEVTKDDKWCAISN